MPHLPKADIKISDDQDRRPAREQTPKHEITQFSAWVAYRLAGTLLLPREIRRTVGDKGSCAGFPYLAPTDVTLRNTSN